MNTMKYVRALSFMSGGKALTGCGCMHGTTFSLAGMGTPVGMVSPNRTSTKDDVSTPGVKVLRELLFTGITDRNILKYRSKAQFRS